MLVVEITVIIIYNLLYNIWKFMSLWFFGSLLVGRQIPINHRPSSRHSKVFFSKNAIYNYEEKNINLERNVAVKIIILLYCCSLVVHMMLIEMSELWKMYYLLSMQNSWSIQKYLSTSSITQSCNNIRLIHYGHSLVNITRYWFEFKTE